MTENVRRSARALLFEGDGCLVLIKRTKTGQEPYWVTVGGGSGTGGRPHRGDAAP